MWPLTTGLACDVLFPQWPIGGSLVPQSRSQVIILAHMQRHLQELSQEELDIFSLPHKHK